MTTKPPKRPLGPGYWRLWTASVVSNLGDGIAQIAYPWLASAVTRNPLLIALIAVMQRLPWLVFTLPAGVITDRVDRRKIMVAMDAFRTVVTVVVALAVLGAQDGLPSPGELQDPATAVATNTGVYLVLLVASLLFGLAEVLRDNAAQTIIPALVDDDQLEVANGRQWGAEMVANTFVGPPIGSLLIAVAFAVPFFIDAGTFAVAAAMVFFIAGEFKTKRDTATPGKVEWRKEIAEGFRWLWRHEVLRPMAITLGFLNGLMMLANATFVLFAQEILGTSAFEFAILGTGAAIGGILGSFLAPRLTARIGDGTALFLELVGAPVATLLIGLSSQWPVVWLIFGVEIFLGTVWNVITVSFRQSIIPDELLGRVNSVYRFFGWGMMSIGLAIGGVVVAITEWLGSREMALRMPWFVAAAAGALVAAYAIPRLTTEKLAAARTTAAAEDETATAE